MESWRAGTESRTAVSARGRGDRLGVPGVLYLLRRGASFSSAKWEQGIPEEREAASGAQVGAGPEWWQETKAYLFAGGLERSLLLTHFSGKQKGSGGGWVHRKAVSPVILQTLSLC